MQDAESLDTVLGHSRRERPEPLPVDFAASVIGRLKAERRRKKEPVLSLAITAMAAVVTALAISLGSAAPEKSTAPPRLSVFGKPAVQAPFDTP
ncbi:hypothetical protein OJ996_09805 [Luteolibacter sp. GHJ8]|uniref:Uncharacterized protein n=1 Tax=Luteolibacter rhizosphaerae TaxID=2989719 RepID=A0ABT3G2V3_9BACT|nr:hypothetical protein [Luteolibacter rhizosphaerae]MCW1913869.1 hypothetical protein [Luteolibacter rhizosphaerae]